MTVTMILLAACLLGIPLLAGLTAGALRRSAAPRLGWEEPSLFQPFCDFFALLRHNPATVSYGQIALALLSLIFQVMALVLLCLQKNLPPVLFLQAAGVLTSVMAGMFRPASDAGSNRNQELKEFLAVQPLLFLVAVGIFVATGSFSLAAVRDYPRLLAADLPFLWLAVMLVGQNVRKAWMDEGTKEQDASDPAGALIQLANCYQIGLLLLLAGYFWSFSLTGAVVAAAILHVGLTAGFRLSPRLSRWLERPGKWHLVYFAVVLNLLWVYIKFWL